MSLYFLTGATGVVGSAIAQQLLAEPSCRLTLLIRAKSDGDLVARREELLRSWNSAAGAAERVGAIRGDTSQPGFGLSQQEFDRLASECTHVVHCAAIVKMNLPLEAARSSAIGAARNVVAFASVAKARGRLEKVEFLSTVGVGGRRSDPLPERWITERREFHNTYEQAKAEAENFIREHAEAAFPITVHRPSMVVGDSRSGRIARFQVFYHLAEFLSGRRTFGMFPRLNGNTLDLVPADYVARAVVWSSRQRSTAGRILHLCSGPEGAVRLENLRARVRARWEVAGVRLPHPFTVPTGVLRGAVPVLRLVVPRKLRRALETLPIFLDYLAEDETFLNRETTALLSAAGIELPCADQYLDRVLDYYLAHREEARD